MHEKIRAPEFCSWADYKENVNRNPNRGRAAAAGAMPLRGTLAAIPWHRLTNRTNPETAPTNIGELRREIE